MDRLTQRQRDIIAFIRTHHETFGFAPTYREIGAGVGLLSKSSVHYQLHVLEARGLVQLNRGLSRAIVGLRPAVIS